METPTTTQRCYKSRKVDRFSDLPYNNFDLIFSFLGMREFIRLSVCSKRLRDVCFSVQCLTFESSKSYGKVTDEEFLSYSRFLIDRGDRNLNHLRIRWELGCNPQENIPDERFIYCVGTWIHYAVRCNLKTLYFQFTGERGLHSFSLPHCLFSSKTLKSMTIDLNGNELKFPSSTGFINLRCLVLKGIIISDKNSSANLFSSLASLRNLKDLWVEKIGGIKTMEVNSSSLETFYFVEDSTNIIYNLRISCESLQTLFLDWNCYMNCIKVSGGFATIVQRHHGVFLYKRERSDSTEHQASLRISAPNLTYFEWRGNLLPDNCFFDRFTKLSDAKVFLALKKFDDPEYLCKAIRSLRDAKHLQLYASLIKDLFREGYLPIALDNVQNLTLRINKKLNFARTSAIGSFLKGTSALKSLRIKSHLYFVTDNVQGVDVKFWESQNLAFVHKLQMVEIELLNGVTELELARFFLKHAKELKQMVIFHSSSLPTNVIQAVDEFKMSSRDRVVFKVK